MRVRLFLTCAFFCCDGLFDWEERNSSFSPEAYTKSCFIKYKVFFHVITVLVLAIVSLASETFENRTYCFYVFLSEVALCFTIALVDLLSDSDSDPSLWTYALSYFASIDDQDCSEEIQEVLARIDRNNLLPPLRVRALCGQ